MPNRSDRAHKINSLEIALAYHARGWCVIPLPYKEKSPKLRGWQTLTLDRDGIREHFSKPANIGVRLGAVSGHLTDVDLDCQEAVQLAEAVLPATLRFGREAKPASHWLYTVKGCKTRKFDASFGMVAEIRSDGAQTVFPGSTHPSGQLIEWDAHKAPIQELAPETLTRLVGLLASCAVLLHHWTEGQRDELATAAAGVLLRAGLEPAQVDELIGTIATLAGDEDVAARCKAERLHESLQTNAPVPGIPRLIELLGPDGEKIAGWLNMKQQDVLDELVAQLVRVIECKGFVRIRDGVLFDNEQVRDDLLNGSRKLFSALLAHTKLKRVERLAYQPGRELFVTEEGVSAFNTWRPGDIVPIPATEREIRPWLEHIAWLWPNKIERECLLDWLAHALQRAFEKPNWHPLLGGGQRIGKSLALAPWLKLIGERNYKMLQSENLFSEFTGWLRGAAVVVVEELMLQEHSRKAVANKLKQYMATPPVYVPIREMYKGPSQIANIVRFVFYTNKDDAVSLEHDDGRFFILWSDVQRRENAYYDKLGAWLADPANVARIGGWLMARDLSAFNPHARAPHTTAKDRMQLAALTAPEDQVAVMIEERRPPFHHDLITLEEVCQTTLLPEAMRSRNKLGDLIKRLGGGKLYRGEQVRLGDGSKRRVWAVRNFERYRDMPEGAIRASWMEERKGVTGAFSGVNEATKVVPLRRAKKDEIDDQG